MKHFCFFLSGIVSIGVLAGCGGTSATTAVPPQQSFSVEVAPSSVSLTAGGSPQLLTVATSPQNNFSGNVAVKLGSLPAGVTATPAALSLAAGSLGQFTLSAAADSVPSQAKLMVSAVSGTIEQSASASLTISEAVKEPVPTTVSLNAVSFDFGNNLVGNSMTKAAVQVTNTGSSAMTLNPSVSGDASFALAKGTNTNSCGTQLAPAASCSVVLTYLPTNASAPAPQTATLNLGMQEVAAGTPQTVAVSGTAFSVPVGQVTSTNNPQVALYSVNLPFAGSVTVNFGTDTNYGLSTSSKATSSGGTVSVFVAGMRASTQYHMQAAIALDNGITLADSDHTFTTGAIANNMVLNAKTTTAPGRTTRLITFQRSRVRARMSALIAATVIGRPRMDPELSINRVTTVSRKSVSRSRL